MNGGVCLVIDVDPHRLQRRVQTRYLDTVASTVDEAVERALRAKRDRRGAAASASSATRPPWFPSCCAAGVPVDIVTDQTSAHDPLSYMPEGVDPGDAPDYAAKKPEEFTDRARASMAKHVEAHGRLPRRRRRGVRLRQLDPRRGAARRLRTGVRVPRLRAGLHPAAVLRGQGPVPLGRAVRRPGRHRRHRPGHPRPVPGERARWPGGSAWPASGSRSRACPRASAGSATANGTGPACGSTRWSPRARCRLRS